MFEFEQDSSCWLVGWLVAASSSPEAIISHLVHILRSISYINPLTAPCPYMYAFRRIYGAGYPDPFIP